MPIGTMANRVPPQTVYASYWAINQAEPLHDFRNAKGSIEAFINHSRWILECPNCPNAMSASKEFRYFICFECGSTDNDGDWYHVLFPRDADMDEIEDLLLERSVEEARNWYPGEDLVDLEEENLVLVELT